MGILGEFPDAASSLHCGESGLRIEAYSQQVRDAIEACPFLQLSTLSRMISGALTKASYEANLIS